MSPQDAALQADLDESVTRTAQAVIDAEAALAGAQRALDAALAAGCPVEAEMQRLDALLEVDAKQLARAESLRRQLARKHRPACEEASRALEQARRASLEAVRAADHARRAAIAPESPAGRAASDSYWKARNQREVEGLALYGPAQGDLDVARAAAALRSAS